ncbi:hypothetical protein VYU27_010254, partial [Nannochloropsis oceanica]
WVTATPTLSGDGKTLYVGGEDSFVYALDASDGTLRWKAAVQGGIYTPLALSLDGHVLAFTTRSGLLMCMNASATDPLSRNIWAMPTRTKLSAAVFSPQDFAIYVGTDAGELLSVETSSGQLLWSYQAVGPIITRPVVVEPKGAMVLATTQNGLLTAIRALPAGHSRGHAGKNHEGIREDQDKIGPVLSYYVLHAVTPELAAPFISGDNTSTLFVVTYSHLPSDKENVAFVKFLRDEAVRLLSEYDLADTVTSGLTGLGAFSVDITDGVKQDSA